MELSVITLCEYSTVHIRSRMKLLSLIAIIMCCISCTAAPEQPSILLIAVDSLHSDIVTCPEYEGNEESGFRSLCQESVLMLLVLHPSVKDLFRQ